MQIERAMSILGVSSGIEFHEIKKKYRRLMIQHHPDAIGSELPEHVKRAQELNEAYHLLQAEYEHIQKKMPREKTWNARVNEQAFAERIIFIPYTLEHDRKDLYQEICRGRYMWNPDEEEFYLLLRSVRCASMELLRQAEAKSGLYGSEQEWDGIRFPCQVKLFHRMMQQYIHPYECLQKLWSPVGIDPEEREIYEFRAFLCEKGRTARYRSIAALKRKEHIRLSFSGENKIAAWNDRKESLGFLFLEEDALYYLLLPLLKEQIARIKVEVQEVSVLQKPGFAQAKANLTALVRITREAKQYVPPMKNPEIAELLVHYERSLKEGRDRNKQEKSKKKAGS